MKRLFVFLVLISFLSLAGFVYAQGSSDKYLVNSVIGVAGCDGDEGYEEDVVFSLPSGLDVRHCVKKEGFSESVQFVTHAYLVVDGVCGDRNGDGSGDVPLSFNAFKDEDAYEAGGQPYSLISLCLATSQGVSSTQLILDSYFTRSSCSGEVTGSFVDGDGREWKHCVERYDTGLEIPDKDEVVERGLGGSPIKLASFYDGENGVLNYDGEKYEFCQDSLMNSCEDVDTNLIPGDGVHFLDTNNPARGEIEDSDLGLVLDYPCFDMDLQDSVAMARISVPSTSQEFLAVGLYIPKGWFILDGTLRVSDSLDIFSYNPTTQEIILARESSSQTEMSGDVTFLVVKPDGAQSDKVIASYASPFSAGDMSLDFAFREIETTSSGECACWRGGSQEDLEAVMGTVDAFSSGAIC